MFEVLLLSLQSEGDSLEWPLITTLKNKSFMLVNFSFKNFRSFKDEMTLSMEAASIQELSDAVVKLCGEELLPAAVMYGAN